MKNKSRQIYVHEETLREIETIANEKRINRNALVNLALKEYIDSLKEEHEDFEIIQK